MNNEILNDCKLFADMHRGKNKTSGPHWSTIIRFPKLYDEAVRLQNQVRTLLKSIEFDIWTPVSEKLPKALQKKYVICQRENGKRYTGLAQYVPYREVLEEDFIDEDYWGNFDCSDYDDEQDKWYAKEGWYEFSIESEMAYRLSDPVILWSDVPHPPKELEVLNEK